MINVYDGGTIVARVKYNSRLDHWDGHNWTCGETGVHLGITQLEDGRYVLIHGYQWAGDPNVGEVVSIEEALQAVLANDPSELKNFSELKELSEKLVKEKE